MRALLWIVIVVTALYSGYWFVGARGAEKAAHLAVEEAAARGISVAWDDLAVAGFPNRFDLTMTGPRVLAEQHQLRWSGDFAQVFSLSYAPWRLIAALPPEQHIGFRGQDIELGTTRMQASLYMKPGLALLLDDFKGVAEGVSLRSDRGWSASFRSLNLSLVAGEGNTATAALRLGDLRPDPAVIATLTRVGLPELIERVDVLADLVLTAPVAMRAARPEVLEVMVREARFLWGPLKVSGTGSLRAGPVGRAEGEIRLRIEGWSEGLAALEAAGVIPPRFQAGLRSIVTGLAERSSEPGVLELPLVMLNGRMMLGPVPLGDAPMMR